MVYCRLLLGSVQFQLECAPAQLECAPAHPSYLGSIQAGAEGGEGAMPRDGRNDVLED